MIPRLVLALLLLAAPAGAQLELRFLNVGQGDAAVIQEGGKTALIDAGPSSEIVRHLRTLGIDTVDLLVASHNHADHIGGMTGVLASTVVRFYLDNGVPHTTATYQRTIQAVAASGAQYLRPTARTITLGGARLRVVPPPGVTDQNNASVGILVEYGEFRALLTGDSEWPELRHWLASASIVPVTVVKVAHHGSWNGTSDAWVAALRPRAAVISVGRNSYGHPSPAVIQQWESVGATVYRTDQNGSVLVIANRDGSFVVTADHISAAGATPRAAGGGPAPPPAAVDSAPRACCRVCTRGKACGNSCISRNYQCRRPPGCACDAWP